MKQKTKAATKRLCLSAMFMAANIILSSSIFSIAVPGGHLYMNDVVICTASVILDPISAFFVGGVGAFLGDLIFYPTPMFVSLVTHGLQAVVISLISHYTFKKYPVLSSCFGVFAGAVIMVTGYTVGRAFVYSTLETALIKLPFQIFQAAVGAVLSMVICWVFKIEKVCRKLLSQ